MEAKVAKVNGGRFRKVTLTEINDEAEWKSNDPENIDEEMVIEKSTDEVFTALENVVTEWKHKLEIVVADGLKKIKKTHKEKKTMMKYLPGDGVPAGNTSLLKAKESILNEWKGEVTDIFHATHNKLSDLGINQDAKVITTTDKFFHNKLAKKNEKDENLKTDSDMKNFLRELEVLYQQYNEVSHAVNKVPIYNLQKTGFNKEIPRERKAPFGWWYPLCTLPQIVNYPKNTLTYPGNEKVDSEMIKDFVQVQKPYNLLLKEWYANKIKVREPKATLLKKKNMKKIRKGKKSMKGLKDRKEVRGEKKVMLREFEDKGGKHFIVVSKNVQSPSALTDVEDIFADWKTNFALIKRPRSLKPRVRKLSHRQERKEMIKEAQKESETVFGPLTYSQMLRKNLKIVTDQPSVEEIFENWRAIIEEDKDEQPTSHIFPASKQMEDIDFFKVWKHNLHVEADRTQDIDILSTSTWIPSLANLECGQPTVPCIPKKGKSKKHVAIKQKKNTNNASDIKKTTKESTTLKPLKSSMQVVPYIEKKILLSPPVNSMAAIPLPDLFTNKDRDQQSEQGKNEFKPSKHSQRMVRMDTEPLKDIATLTEDKRFSQKDLKVKTPIAETVVVEQKDKVKKSDLEKEVPSKQNQDFTRKSVLETVKTLKTTEKEVKMVKPTQKRKSTPENEIKEVGKIARKQTWASLLVPTEEPSGRGDKKQPEDVFLSWRHIFAESHPCFSETSQVQPENIFFDWLFNFEQKIPVVKQKFSKEKELSPSQAEISPKPGKKEMRKQTKVEDDNERITDIKQNRRQDFVRNAMIKDKKRNEATRKSTGKKIK